MIKYTVKVPMEHVTEARRLCRVLRTGVQGLREQAEKLKEVDPVKDGLAAKDRADAEILEIQKAAVEIKLEAMAEITTHATAFIEAIDHQAGLKGQELTSAPDVLQFGDKWFSLCLTAAENPEGYAMTQLFTPGELRRMLQAYGVLDAAEVPDDEA